MRCEQYVYFINTFVIDGVYKSHELFNRIKQSIRGKNPTGTNLFKMAIRSSSWCDKINQGNKKEMND